MLYFAGSQLLAFSSHPRPAATEERIGYSFSRFSLFRFWFPRRAASAVRVFARSHAVFFLSSFFLSSRESGESRIPQYHNRAFNICGTISGTGLGKSPFNHPAVQAARHQLVIRDEVFHDVD